MATTLQPSMAGGELAESLHSRVDLDKYNQGLALCRNFRIDPHGGASNRSGLEFIVEALDSATAWRIEPFVYSRADNYILAFGDQKMFVLRNGGVVLEAAQLVTGITVGTKTLLQFAAAHGYVAGDVVYLDGFTGSIAPYLAGRFMKIDFVTATTALLDVDTSGQAWAGGGSTGRVYVLATTWTSSDLWEMRFEQAGNVMTITMGDHSQAAYDLVRVDHDNWTLTAVAPAITEPAPTGLAFTSTGLPTAGTGNELVYQVTAVNDTTGEESLPAELSTAKGDDWTAGDWLQLTWDDMGVSQYNVYKKRGGVFGFIGVAETNEFNDINVLADTLTNPPIDRNPFASSADPAACTYYQQRKVFANLPSVEDGFEFSKPAQFANFSQSVSVAPDDAISVRLVSLQANAVEFMVPLTSLIVFTSGSEWKIDSGTDGFETATIHQDYQSGYGCSHYLPPNVIGDTIIFAEASDSVVRTFGYTLEKDKYRGNDLTVLASHLFEQNYLVDWAWAQAPHAVLWCVRDDGTLVGLTYLEEHNIWAWHRHDTDGFFESVAAVREGREDRLYCVVRRTVNGQDRRYIERMASRRYADIVDAFFVDAGLTYNGAATTTITGLWHLEGKTISALADANVERDLVVENGMVTLQKAAGVVQVGLPYDSDLKTLPIEIPLKGGTVQSRVKRVTRVKVRVKGSRGLWAGPDFDHLVEYKQRKFEDYDTPVAPLTGVAEVYIPTTWTGDGQFVIRQSDPLPLSVLSLMPEVDVGG